PPAKKLGAPARKVVADLLAALESGSIRAAERDAKGNWRAVAWVKRGILLGFRVVELKASAVGPPTRNGARLTFVDKDTFTPRQFATRDGVRVVPGGSMVRRGAYLAAGA